MQLFVITSAPTKSVVDKAKSSVQVPVTESVYHTAEAGVLMSSMHLTIDKWRVKNDSKALILCTQRVQHLSLTLWIVASGCTNLMVYSRAC